MTPPLTDEQLAGLDRLGNELGYSTLFVKRDDLLAMLDEIKASRAKLKLVAEVLKSLEEAGSCRTCEGGGRLSADRKAHSQSDWLSGKVETRDCPECGGSGRSEPDTVDLLTFALAEPKEAP